MPKVRVHNFSISLDGYVAGPSQSMDHPLGVGGIRLHEWAFAAFDRAEGGEDAGIDGRFVAAREEGVGATIMGRNMFGPVRGSWDDDSWRGWWGDDPPYHHPVFVLTHHPRDSFDMEGGTSFHFVTEGPEAAMTQALEAANGADVAIGGGASTVRQYLELGLIDDLHLAIVPTLLGGGERLFEGLDVAAAGYECIEHVASTSVTHVRLGRTGTTAG
jgi:dihydrofolate reductase